MNYRRHYERLITRARQREVPTGYTEKHHILPRCLGGSNDPENLVRLTPEEHFVAHQPLVKIHPAQPRLVFAAVNMTAGNQRLLRSNKLYGWLRRRMSAGRKGTKATPESRARMSAAHAGKKRKPLSEDHRRACSEAAKKRGVLPETMAALQKTRREMTRRPHSEDTKRRIRESNKSKAAERDFSYLQDAHYRHEQSQKMKRIWAQRKRDLERVS